MNAEEVLAVVDGLEEAGCWVALERGWGVDALAGRRTRTRVGRRPPADPRWARKPLPGRIPRRELPVPAGCFGAGHVLGRRVTCLSTAQQIEWHGGYELRDTDRADLAVLHELARGGR